MCRSSSPALDELVVQVHVQVADLHRGRVHQQVVHLADRASVGGEHLPTPHVRITLGHLEIVQLVQRHHSVHRSLSMCSPGFRFQIC